MQVVLPLAVNTTVDCKWRDSEFRLAKVVERRARADKPDEYEYYVHYDRRTSWHHSLASAAALAISRLMPCSGRSLTQLRLQSTGAWMNG